MNGLSSLGTALAGTAATQYSADMQPQAVTQTAVPASPLPQRRGSVGQHADVIGESIFGKFLYGSDQVPQKTNPSWQVGAEKAAPISGFGADVPADTGVVPATAHWGGHGIFGGPQRHGEYGMTRYGTPLTGFGAVPGEWHPSPSGDCCPPLTDMVAHGYYNEDDPRERANMAKYHWPPGSCTATITKGAWPAEWVCNLPNALVVNVFRQSQNQMSGSNYTTAEQYIQAIRAGKAPSPPGFPSLYKAPAAAPSTMSIAPTVAPAMAPVAAAAPVSHMKLFMGLGLGVLVVAMVGGGVFIKKRKSAATPAAA